MTEYFYNEYDTNKKTKKKAILHISGLNSTPVYPLSYNYARAILIFHKPWEGGRKDSLKNKQHVLHECTHFLKSKRCPTTIKQAYTRAKIRYESGIDFFQDNKKDDDTNHLSNDHIDEELQMLIEYSNSFQRKFKDNSEIDRFKYDIGVNYDWCKFNIENGGDTWLLEEIEKHNNWNQDTLLDNGEALKESEILNLPTKQDGSKYNMKDLKGNQQAIVCTVIQHLTKWIDYANGKNNSYQPLRMTVLGKAGTGKSYVINTVVTEIRNLTKQNNSVVVVAPMGTSAYNIDGQTIHQQFGISTNNSTEMTAKTRERLKYELKHLVVLIIDEQSMVDSKSLRQTEKISEKLLMVV